MIEHELAALYAAIACGKEQGQFIAQAPERKQQRRPGFDAIVQIDAMREVIRRLVQRQHFLIDATHAVDACQCRRPDAPRQFRARQGEYIAQGAHPDIV